MKKEIGKILSIEFGWEEDRTHFRTVGELLKALMAVHPDLPIFSTWETICPPIWAVEVSIDRSTGSGAVFIHCDQDPPSESEVLDVHNRGGVVLRPKERS